MDRSDRRRDSSDPDVPADARVTNRAAACAALVYTFTVVMLGTTIPTPMYALYSEELGFSILTSTIVFATYAGGVLVALIAFGRWSDSLGRRPMLLLGVTFAAASAVVFVTAGPVWQLLVGRFLSGLSAGIFAGTATAAVIEMAPDSWKDRASSIATAANIGGLGLGPLVAGVLVQFLPYPLHLSFVVHLVLLAIGAVAVFMVPETVDVQQGARPALQRLSVPAETRPLFVRAAIAAVAGFAVLGLCTAVVPGFLSSIIGISSHFVAGLVVFLVFAASAVAQIAARRLDTNAALVSGCAALVVGMLLIMLALSTSSLVALVAGGIIAGIGQGLGFGTGLAAVAGATPPERKAEVTSTFFVVAYVAISVPVIGEGVAARSWGLQTAGIVFAAAVAVLAAVALVASAVEARRSSAAPENSEAAR
nr:MFS transporter [Rhodococcus trifolii]